MMLFWFLALLMLSSALLFVLSPLISPFQSRKGLARNDINVILFKDQCAELEADLATGVLTREQFDQAKEDLERSLLQDIDKAEPGKVDRELVSSKHTAIALGLFIPILAISLYLKLGAGEAGLDPKRAVASSEAQVEGHQGTLEEQIRSLQEQLQSNPDDLESWVMLARSYYFLKQYQPASGAFAKAVAMTDEKNADLLADYADALAMASERSMAGKPTEAVQKALQVEPLHRKALWLAATAAYQNKQYDETLKYYSSLRDQFPKGSDSYYQMLRNIGEVKQLLGMSIEAEAAELQQAESQQKTASITGSVSLEPSLQSKVEPGDTLFVYARAASGPKMPLAIVRMTAGQLPVNYVLDDSSAMNPQMKLSAFKEVVVSARISKTGNAVPQAGDLQGVSGVVALGSQVNLVINDTVSGSAMTEQTAQPTAVVNTTQPAANTQAVVGGTVNLDESLRSRVSADDTVFIFARASSGPRMPLAVLRKQVKDLPVSFSLDDSNAMSPQFALSKFTEVVVGARISKTGDAIAKPGDLQGSSSVIKVGTQDLKIIIDSAVP